MQSSKRPHHNGKRIAFYGLFGLGNLGNECTLQAMLYHARKHLPDGEFTCICSGPEDASNRHNIPALPISWRDVRKPQSTPRPGSLDRLIRLLRKFLIGMPSEFLDWFRVFRTLKGFHMLIVPGTGFLTDALSGPLGWPYDIFKWSLMARLLRCRLLFVSVGAGPIYSPLGRWFIKSALSLAEYRSYRDISTIEYLKGIGFSVPNDRVCPDLAFNLPDHMLPPNQIQPRSRPTIGVGIMSPPGRLATDTPSSAAYLAYLKTLVTLVQWLLQHDYYVRLLIGDFVYDSSARRDFMHLLREHASPYNEEQLLNEPALSVGQLMLQLASTDIVIATRFHNVLLALVLNKPVLAVTFHHKGTSLMREMGLSDHCEDIDQLDGDRLIKQFRQLEACAPTLGPLIKGKTDAFRTALDQQYAAIFRNTGRAEQFPPTL